MPRRIESRLFISDTFALGEGPFWWDNRLWWVDIDGHSLHSVNEEGGDRWTYDMGRRISVAVPIDRDRFVVGLEDGVGYFDRSSGAIEIISSPEAEIPGSRFNDGKCDPAGRFIAGTFNMQGAKGASALYSLNHEGELRKLFGEVTCSNGLAWSADGSTMYYIDSPRRAIEAFNYDLKTGDVSGRRVGISIPEGVGIPDGMSIDVEGNLWVGFWDGHAVRCWSPETGECLAEVPVAAKYVTSCCFGGANLDKLFITTARCDHPAEELAEYPQSGSIFVCEPGVRGTELPVFRSGKV